MHYMLVISILQSVVILKESTTRIRWGDQYLHQILLKAEDIIPTWYFPTL